ncbi:MAG: hypothetical protein LBN25_04310, partial [Christensenellaceae bacterium]|nr:hypothetical protein [Christensenellaceae bacterium]
MMFEKTARRIFNSGMSVILTLVLATSIVSYIVLLSATYNTVIAKEERRLQQAVYTVNFYLAGAQTDADRFFVNTEFLTGAIEKNPQFITPALNSFVLKSQNIDAAIFYSADGEVFCSDGVGELVPLNELRASPSLDGFFNGNTSKKINYRTEAIAGVYGNKPYQEGNGIISIIRAILYDGIITGYLFLDILPATLYGALLENT